MLRVHYKWNCLKKQERILSEQLTSLASIKCGDLKGLELLHVKYLGIWIPACERSWETY